MDNDLIDAVARSVATRLPRRTMAGCLAGGGLAATLSGSALANEEEKEEEKRGVPDAGEELRVG